jgi:3-dehydroquinate synthase
MQTLHVDLGERSYPIYIGQGLLQHPELFTAHLSGQQVMIVSNDTVAPLYLETVRRNFAGYDCQHLVLPDGEEYKNLDTCNQIFDALLTNRFDRQSTLLALGGGVIGDITGFAAACYQRGIAFMQVPTTLLAQVDSSVGGKTGVNHPLGKNMIGAFHQPRCVIADTDTLTTLDDRQLRAGIAEVIKYGVIRDHELFDWLEAHIQALLDRDPDALAYVIQRSCINKADIVAQDELESGTRALLNLGHTFGHAIEAGMGYGNWLHGEAVAAGMVMAAVLSRQLGWLGAAEVERITALIQKAQLPVHSPADMDTDRFLQLMSVDKKVQHGKLRFVLLKNIGNAVVSDQASRDQIQLTVQTCRENTAEVPAQSR